MNGATADYDIVIPTLGRPELHRLLSALAGVASPPPGRIVIVDDRGGHPPPLETPPALDHMVRVFRSGGKGPAAARNLGWRACSAAWVVFLDDDVVPGDRWGAELMRDLAGVSPDVVGVQATVSVPRPRGRRATDWERNVAGLATARWITADMAYRRWSLEMLDGFDERFPHAYREDADLALRILEAGLALEQGLRKVVHPIRAPRRFGSIGRQRGNADDVTMSLLHGPGWRARAGVGRGRLRWNLATAALGLLAMRGALAVNRRQALGFGIPWLGTTGSFAWSRIRPGPRDPGEIIDMTLTSLAIPFAAGWHWAKAWLTAPRRLSEAKKSVHADDLIRGPVEAVLFDRDGTLIRDVPYNGDPGRVTPMPGAAEALRRLRRWGLPVGVVSNQSGVGRGLITPEEVQEVNDEIERFLGPFDHWGLCLHHPDQSCECRKPEPGLVLKAAAELGVAPERCLVIGDIGSDVEAARRAGASHIMVPTARTRPEEIRAAGTIAADLLAAVDRMAPFVEVAG